MCDVCMWNYVFLFLKKQWEWVPSLGPIAAPTNIPNISPGSETVSWCAIWNCIFQNISLKIPLHTCSKVSKTTVMTNIFI